MPRREIITLLFWLFLSIVVGLESLRFGVGSFTAPGPGFLPFGAALAICIFVIFLFLKEKGKDYVKNIEPLFHSGNVKSTLYIVVSLFAYPLLLSKLGFFICTLLFIGFCMKKIGAQKWRVALRTSFVVAVFSHLLFISWLEIQIPELRLVQQAFAWGGRLWR
jgi:hypothetical protein